MGYVTQSIHYLSHPLMLPTPTLLNQEVHHFDVANAILSTQLEFIIKELQQFVSQGAVFIDGILNTHFLQYKDTALDQNNPLLQ